VHDAGELPSLEAVDGGQHLAFGDAHHRIAVRALVAGQDEGVQRQRIGVGHRPLLLDEHAEDAGLDG